MSRPDRGARKARKNAKRARRAPPRRALVDPSRNLHIDKGRQITIDDVRPYALAMHHPCRGNGVVGLVKDAEGKAVAGRPCICATKRFFKAHPEIIMEANGAAWWPLDVTANETPKQEQPAAPLTACPTCGGDLAGGDICIGTENRDPCGWAAA